MSYVFTTIAWKAPLRTAAKFVLVSLADQSNDDGYCWPSVAKLADRTALSERAVQAALTELCEEGYLVRHLRTGRSTYYQLLTPADAAPRSTCTPAGAAPLPPHVVHPTPAAGAPITTKELSEELPLEIRASLAERKKRQPAKSRKAEQTLPEWVKSQPPGVELIGPEHPARVFAAQAGIPDDWVGLAWKAFTDKHLTSGKRYKDWGLAFRNAVAGNWERVWYAAEDGTWKLTTVGHGLDRVMNGGVQ